jgi:hypothetical protein
MNQMNTWYEDQDENWRSDYPFLVDYSIHDEILLSKESYHIYTKIYRLQQELRHIHIDDPRIGIANTFLNPVFFPAGREYTFYELLLEIKWRIEYIDDSIEETRHWQLMVHNKHGRYPMYWLGSVERVIESQIKTWKEYRRDWHYMRERYIVEAQRRRANQFFGLLRIKFASLGTCLDDIAVKIVGFVFEFHHHNSRSIYSGHVSLRKKRQLS